MSTCHRATADAQVLWCNQLLLADSAQSGDFFEFRQGAIEVEVAEIVSQGIEAILCDYAHDGVLDRGKSIGRVAIIGFKQRLKARCG